MKLRNQSCQLILGHYSAISDSRIIIDNLLRFIVCKKYFFIIKLIWVFYFGLFLFTVLIVR